MENIYMQEFINEVNKIRLLNKNRWYFTSGSFGSHVYQIKGYNTWLQVCMIDANINHPSGMDISVAEFKKHLAGVVEYYQA